MNNKRIESLGAWLKAATGLTLALWAAAGIAGQPTYRHRGAMPRVRLDLMR